MISGTRDAVDGLLSRRVFEAMGSTVELILEGAPSDADEALAAAELEIHRLERMLSRFLPDSELSLLNDAGTLDVSTELAEVTTLALEARERTGGRFDPTVHNALVAAGYDRSFEDMVWTGVQSLRVPLASATSRSTGRESRSSAATVSTSAGSQRDTPQIEPAHCSPMPGRASSTRVATWQSMARPRAASGR